ncbi:hypothetical protein GWI33_011648 [Rhynchophorus ferrugineus]|uniref:Aldehyde dehydrogenase domain-containing protein n=1 Tax=Rhynchophorus ferrugineus TaxID=354439 RepID=A0A834I9F6_RHYFE|nr:hypothetical protein GWI33_011648 [Rhynchophorus ferrugineus]
MHKATKRILWGRMLNSGQTCLAPDYLLCTREVQEKFLKEAKQIIEQFWGENPSKSESLSKIVSQKHFKRLHDFLKLEKVALGGQVNYQDCVIGPTILTDVSPHSLVMEEEIFGPILPIINIKDPEEAIDFINSREKPLAIYLFSDNKNTQNMFLTKTSSGGLTINDTISHIGVENLPFGGVGDSGIGSYHGKYGFDTFTHKKAVLIKNFSGVTEMTLKLRYPPYSEKKTTLLTTVIKKRRGISMKYVPNFLIFVLGMGLSLLLEYFFDII